MTQYLDAGRSEDDQVRDTLTLRSGLPPTSRPAPTMDRESRLWSSVPLSNLSLLTQNIGRAAVSTFIASGTHTKADNSQSP